MPFHFSARVPGRASCTILRVFCTLLLALLLQSISFNLQGGHTQTQQRPSYKFDPLTPEERELALRLVEADARVKKLRGQGRQNLISVELATPKTGDQNDETSRHAEILYYRYEGNQGVLVLVDLQQRSVQEAVAINGDAVPLVAEEVNQALSLALQNRTLINLLGPNYQQYRVATQNSPEGEPNRVEALRLFASSPDDPCYRRRCVSLLFRQGDTFLTGTEVIVDLTTQRVRVEQPAQRRPSTMRRRGR
ncbi:MAG TPA: hypothetical protein VFV61_04400 [Pyrinomonadaceae bacterium]|nr:hypothetical protein [Pyrinomonadaceae bacterium]